MQEDDELWSQYEFVVSDKKILFDCLNVAWTSKKRETLGGLLFPYERFASNRDRVSDIRIVALHHPVHWLRQEQYRDVRARVRLFGDLVFTGHEHVDGASFIDDSDAGESMLIEAGALQMSNNHAASTFNVVQIDIDEGRYKYDVFTLNDNEYIADNNVGSWESFKLLPKRKSNDFEISEETCCWLKDSGANYTHPSKAEILLGDIFIYPDIEDLNSDDGDDRHIISSSILRDISKLKDGVVVTGQEKSGKTALLRTLFLEYHELALVPNKRGRSEYFLTSYFGRYTLTTIIT